MKVATCGLCKLPIFHSGYRRASTPSIVGFNSRVNSRRISNSTKESKTTALYDFHRRLGARIELFAGYLMPIVYKNQTIKSEHMQTRTLASVFDVSHMMQFVVRGEDRHIFLERLTVADIINLKLNKCTLSVFTNDNGGIIDDCIISQRENYLHVVSNAGNSDTLWQWLNENMNNDLDVSLERLSGKSLIALQGPSASKILQTMVDDDLSDMEFMNVIDTRFENVGSCQVARCGYTGEDGFEVSVDSNYALKFVDMLCQRDVKPAGLGARDTLRLEAGLCLHGHDITEVTTPVEAGLSWTVHKRRRENADFFGSKIILDQLKNGSKVRRVGLMAAEGGPPAREGSKITDLEGSSLGVVTSGTFSPVLGKNIAMAYLPAYFLTGGNDLVNCSIRGKNFGYRIAKMPFVKSNYYFKR